MWTKLSFTSLPCVLNSLLSVPMKPAFMVRAHHAPLKRSHAHGQAYPKTSVLPGVSDPFSCSTSGGGSRLPRQAPLNFPASAQHPHLALFLQAWCWASASCQDRLHHAPRLGDFFPFANPRKLGKQSLPPPAEAPTRTLMGFTAPQGKAGVPPTLLGTWAARGVHLGP